jgi:hypothetical protein
MAIFHIKKGQKKKRILRFFFLRGARGIYKDGYATLVPNWRNMPIVGVIRREHTGKAQFTFPETWEEL